MNLGIIRAIMWNNTIKIHFNILFLILGFLMLNKISIAKNESLAKDLILDSSKIELRKPDSATQNELLNNTDYKYDRKGPAPKSAWEKFKEWFWRKVDEIFDSKGGSIGVRIFKYLLIGVAIGLFIYLLVKNNIRAIFYGKSASVKIDFSELEEDIHKINFDELIAEAVSKKDYRKAIRLHFLKLLKQLTDKNLISWKIDKTNHDYLIEMSNKQYKTHFKEIVYTYEYVWYGDFPLDEKGYQLTAVKFKEFNV